MKSKKLIFSIVVCCYNGAEKLPATIKSLRKLAYPKDQLEIIVVNDGSSDASAKVAKRYKGVRLVSHDTNLGIAAARNTGLKEAKGKYIAYIDDDCTANPQWLHELEKALRRPGTVAAGGLIAARSTKAITQRYLIASGYGRPAPLAVGAAKGVIGRFAAYVKDKFKSTRAKTSDETMDVHEAYGANVAFPVTKLKSIKGFNRELNTSEDADVCTRLHQKHPQKAIRFNPKAVVAHDYTTSFSAYLKELFVRQVDTLKYYKQQHKTPPLYPFPPFILLTALLVTFFSPLAAALTLIFLPLVMYGWWPYSAVRSFKPERFVYAYMEWLEESVRVAGLLRALALQPKAIKTGKKLAIVKQAKKTAQHVPSSKMSTFVNKVTSLWGKRRIFAALAIWFIGVNALQLVQGPLQTLPTLLMLVFLPGILLLLALRVRIANLRVLLYAFVLSIILLVCTALAANTVVLLSDHALRLGRPVFLVAINTAIVALFAAAWLRSQNDITFKLSLGWTKIAVLLASLFLPFIGVLASLYLNQSGNNTLSMIVLSVMFVVLATTAICFRKLSSWTIPLVIFSISLTITLMGAMRGTGVSGTDISKEYYLFGLVQHLGYWSPNIFPDPYNACLTIHLLPSLLADLIKVDATTMYRLVLPALYAALPVMVYALYRRFNAQFLAFAGVMFFMIQPVFMKWSAIPIRQMFAFLFFAGLMLALFDKRLAKPARYTLMILFGAGVIFSHYSTAYITLGILVLTYIIFRGRYLIAKHIRKASEVEWKPFITAPLLVSLIAVAAIWYGPITHASGHAQTLLGSGVRQLVSGNGSLVNSKAHSEQANLLDQFNIHSAPRQPEQVWKDYLAETDTKYKRLNVTPLQNKRVAAPIAVASPAKAPYNIPKKAASLITLAGVSLSKLTRVFLLLGLAIFAWQVIKKRTQHEEYNILTLSAALAIFLIIVVPYASIDYDIGRTSQQLLVLLALPTVVGAVRLLRFVTRDKLSEHAMHLSVAGFIITTFLFISGFVGQLTGGQQPGMLLNNSGVQYQIAVQEGETAAAAWLAERHDPKERIHSGYFGRNRLWTAGIARSSLYNDILPWTIDRKAYVFSSTSELQGQGTTYYNGSFVVYDYPTSLLEERKNIMYSNNQARIYK